jgi:hypothetical protein
MRCGPRDWPGAAYQLGAGIGSGLDTMSKFSFADDIDR